MPTPMMNRAVITTRYSGKSAIARVPSRLSRKAASSVFFGPRFSTMIPAGIETIPYARKNENGRKPASARLSLKSPMMIGIKGPMRFVTKEMTNQTHRM